MPVASVIICAHNPRAESLGQALAALQLQSLPREQWELLLVDNATAEPLAKRWDLTWHPYGRHVREEELGLTPARLRGIREAQSGVLIFVDDDNVLAPNYLELAMGIAAAWPMLGAWGGRIEGRYESSPPDWAKPYLGMLALREFEGDHWSNSYDDVTARPYGAGMIIRKVVAKAYAQRLASDPARKGMDRRGGSLISGGDEDMALTAVDLGLGVGMFERLCLAHLIPNGRLVESYLLDLAESTAFSGVILHNLRGRPAPRPTLARRVYEFGRLLLMDARARRFALARRRGTERARRFLREKGDAG